MELYDVKTRGLHSPLNSREISVLFRAGNLLGEAPCKPVSEGRWCTVDELFPLLKYGAGTLSPVQLPRHGSGAAPVLLAVAFVALILGGLAVPLWRPRTSGKTSLKAATSEARIRLPVVARFPSAPRARLHGDVPSIDRESLAAR